MNAVESQVRDVRARLRRTAGADAALRWALYGAMLAGGWLIAAKFLGWPRAPLWAAAALPALAGAAAFARRLDLRQAAAFLDRALGLEERVATAMEAQGPFGAAVATDAARALDPHRVAGVARFRWPSEAKFLVPALAIVALLAVVPDPATSVPMADAGLRAAVDPAVDKLSRTPVADPALAARLEKILADLKSDDLKRMAAGSEGARKLAVEIRTGLAKAGGDRESLRALADRLEAAGAGASSELARRGIDVPDVAPVDLEARIAAAKARGDLASSGARPDGLEIPRVDLGATLPVELRERIRSAARPSDPRYDEIVRRYFERFGR